MPVLVIAEHNQKQLAESTLKTIHAAQQLGDVDVLVMGYQCTDAVNQATKVTGIGKVIQVDNVYYQHLLAENTAKVIVDLAKSYSHLLAPASTFGKNIMPRVAALLDVGQLSDITAIENENTFIRPIYAGNAIATVQSHDNIKVITVRAAAFLAVKIGDTKAPIESPELIIDNTQSTFIGHELTASERPELTSARVVVSGGRGLQKADNFKLLESLADKLNAAIGASRAAVDAGFVPNDYQVGQTGKIVAPELYIAVGISGAIQHLAGITDSKVIVAINKDEEAPIFNVADYGIVGDLFEIVPKLIDAL